MSDISLKKRVNVLHIVPHLRQGGAELMAVHLMAHLDSERFNVSAVVLGQESGTFLERALKDREIGVHFLGKGCGFDPRIYGRVFRALRGLQPDITHTHVHVLRYVLPTLLLGRGGVSIHTVHNIAEQEVERRAQWLQKLAFRLGTKTVAVAQEVAMSLERLYGLRGSTVIPNCIPVDRYHKPDHVRATWRMREGFEPDSILFTSVALMRLQKNHGRLIEAFAKGPGKGLRAKLLLVGGGPLERQIRETISALNLQDKIRLLGMRDDVADILAASDVFVLSSDYEGNPLSVMEAMAAGLPIVSTKVGGIPELVTDGEDGILIEPSDVDGFRFALEVLAEKPHLRRRMGTAAANHARRKFDVRLMVTAYEALYESVCHPGPGLRTLAPTV